MFNVIVFTEVERSKNGLKEDTTAVVVPKLEDRTCSNPLAGLANAINSITNGVNTEETTVSNPIPPTVTNKQAPPKAMVKPQVLTHVIEGFVIQEGKRFTLGYT